MPDTAEFMVTGTENVSVVDASMLAEAVVNVNVFELPTHEAVTAAEPHPVTRVTVGAASRVAPQDVTTTVITDPLGM